jgi:AcrR family transcriptional regulator
MFVERGLYGLTLSDLSRHLDMSKPAIFYHFKTPEDVFISLMDMWAKSGTEFTVAYLNQYIGQGPDKIIIGVMEATLAWLDTDEPFAKLTLAVFLAAQSEKKVEAKLDQLFTGGRQRIASMLKLSSKKFSAREMEKISLHLHSLIVGALIYEMILHGKQHNRNSFRLEQIEKFKEHVHNYF